MSTPRISNRAAREYVRRRAQFKASNMFTDERVLGESVLYIVYSYGEHFPMFIAETTADNKTHWYANQEKWSRSTTRHQSQAHPPYDIQTVPMNTEQMKLIARGGLMELVRRGAA